MGQTVKTLKKKPKVFTTKDVSVGTAGRGCRQGGAAFGSVRPPRNAAFHLQHFGPAVVLVGFLAVLHVLGERDTGGVNVKPNTASKGEGNCGRNPPPPLPLPPPASSTCRGVNVTLSSGCDGSWKARS